jgi:iron complex outermembrane receptor protein
VGFKSINVGHARITGVDFTFTGMGNFFGFPATLLIGYTYTNPIDLVKDSVYLAGKSTHSSILKYRNYFSIKGDFDVTIWRFIAGISYMHISNMINIDETFEAGPIVTGVPSSDILPGLKAYRQLHNKGYNVVDFRLAFMATEEMKFAILLKNVFNEEYMSRPGLIEPPRNLALQYSITF